MKSYWLRMLVCVVASSIAVPSFAQEGHSAQTTAAGGHVANSTGDPSVSRTPRLVRFSATVKNGTEKIEMGPVALTFALYEEQEGGLPLWAETQKVQLDDQGRYTVLLGAAQPEGLPLDLFVSGRARWLGVRLELPGQEELPRILLVGVPYALKAAGADTLGGKPPSAFLLGDALGAPLRQPATGASNPQGGAPVQGASASLAARSAIPMTTVGGGGIANYIPKWLDSANLGNSVICQAGSNVGIGNTIPSAALDVGGNTIVRGTLYARCLENTCFADRFPGHDIGAKINAAYAALPPSGGVIRVSTSASFSTPIVFDTLGKPVILQGSPGGDFGVVLNFTATSGAAVRSLRKITWTTHGFDCWFLGRIV